MTDYTEIDLITDMSSVQGTAVPNGMNFGDFQTDIFKNYNPGVSSGNAYPWLYNLMPAGATDPDGILLEGYVIPANSSGFIPISTFYKPDPYVSLTGTGSDTRLSLQTAVDLKFSVTTDDQNLVFTSSGYDQHKQKMVAVSPTLSASDTPVSTRILKDYTSIFYQNLADTSATISIQIGSQYELRYFDVIQNSVLFASIGNPLYQSPTAGSIITWNFTYTGVMTNPLIPLTPTASLCRPIIDYPQAVAGIQMMVMQNVWGMGNFPNIANYPYQSYAGDLLNNLRTVIGAEQPTDGWVGWQG